MSIWQRYLCRGREEGFAIKEPEPYPEAPYCPFHGLVAREYGCGDPTHLGTGDTPTDLAGDISVFQCEACAECTFAVVHTSDLCCPNCGCPVDDWAKS